MGLLDDLLHTLHDGTVSQVLIGLHWTAVVVTVRGEKRCGLASTLRRQGQHGGTNIPEAGHLTDHSGRALAGLIRAEQPTLAGVGMAAINALLPVSSTEWVELNAAEVIADQGAGKSVALIGHFPFVPKLRTRVGHLQVLEQNPADGDLPASMADQVLPQADIVAITGTTLINHTLDDLLRLCAPEAQIILLGPSSPLSPRLFDYGIDVICGSIVTKIEPVLRAVAQGGNFRQVHRAGVRTVTMRLPA